MILRLLVFLALLLASASARAVEVDLYCQTGTSSTGAPLFLPASSTNPCPSTATISGSVTATSAAVAAASLPSLSAGSTAIYQSLNGGQFVQPVQGNAVTSSSNGNWTNILLSNAAISAGNPLYTVLAGGTAAIGQVTTTPKTGTYTIAGCTVGTSSAQCIASSAATNHVLIENTSASGSIACSWAGGTASLNTTGSVQLAAGQSVLWGPTTSGVPSGAMNCIASAVNTPLYIEYN